MKTNYVAMVSENGNRVAKLTYTGTIESAIENLYCAVVDFTSHRTEKAAKKSLVILKRQYADII